MMERETKKAIAGFSFTLPALLFVMVVMFIPLVYSFMLSLTEYNFVYDNFPTFVGFKNYISVFKDRLFINSIKNTLIFVLAVLPIGVIFPLIIGLLLDSLKSRTVAYEISIFVPIVVPVSLGCLIFLLMMDPSYGYINYIFTKILKISPFKWTENGSVTLLILVLVSNWSLGYQVILFLSALRNVDVELLEAAKIDGATGLQRIYYITLPQIKETTAVVTVFALIRAFKIFVQPMVMTQGGPLHATETVYFYLYKNAFFFHKMGLASTMAYILSFAIIFISLLNLKIFKVE